MASIGDFEIMGSPFRKFLDRAMGRPSRYTQVAEAQAQLSAAEVQLHKRREDLERGLRQAMEQVAVRQKGAQDANPK